MELEGTIAIVTGSTGHLGGAITLALAQNLCDCVCHYNTNEKRAQQLVEQIERLGQKAIAVKADLTKPDQIENLFQKATELGTPQILINSAAAFTRQPLAEITPEKAQQILNLNLIAPILTSQSFAKIINDKFPDTTDTVAKIINIADVGALRPWAKYTLYCSSKAALVAATKSLAKELAPKIGVSAIAPGLVTWPENFNDEQKKRQLKRIPANRIAKPEEIANAVIFLIKNDYIIGHTLNVDGGRVI
ncbi:MAG: SDR family oxidoreductase [Planctomycetes bacterium]|nr:SDR family oxidoreductase [Planctomycetota bacterium]